MSTTRKFSRVLVPLLGIVSVIVMVAIILRAQTNSSQLPAAPTLGANTEFVTDIPQKAMFRNYFSVSLEAAPGTFCGLTYIPPSGEIQQMDTTANTDGLCEWRWKIEESQGKGSGRLIFTIDGISETHFFEILSSF